MNFFKNIYDYRELLKNNVKKEIRGKYKKSVLKNDAISIEKYLRQVKEVAKKINDGETNLGKQFDGADTDIAKRLTQTIENSRAWGRSRFGASKEGLTFFRPHTRLKKGEKKRPYDDIFEE